MHFLVGLRRLGFDAYYVEAHGDTPDLFVEDDDDDGTAAAAAYLDDVMRRFDFGGRWAYHALHEDDRCYGLSEEELGRLYREAELIINLFGGTVPLPEHTETGRLVYLETDPGDIQIELHDGLPGTIEWLDMHCAHFTYAENYGSPDCGLPVSDRYTFRPTRPPIVLDFWRTSDPPERQEFTTVANWRQSREVALDGEDYFWSKDRRVPQVPRPAAAYGASPSSWRSAGSIRTTARLLETNGWQVRDASEHLGRLGRLPRVHRRLSWRVHGRQGPERPPAERLVQRPKRCLPRRRPAGDHAGHRLRRTCCPRARGCSPSRLWTRSSPRWSRSTRDYERHSRAAVEIAREYFDAEVVLTRLLSDIGVSVPVAGAKRRTA